MVKRDAYNVSVDVEFEEVCYHGTWYNVFATVNARIVDCGIGHWECHGRTGVDHRMGIDEQFVSNVHSIECLDYTDPLPSVPFPTSFIEIISKQIERDFDDYISRQVSEYIERRLSDCE